MRFLLQTKKSTGKFDVALLNIPVSFQQMSFSLCSKTGTMGTFAENLDFEQTLYEVLDLVHNNLSLMDHTPLI